MTEIRVLKVGGSVLTDKTRLESARIEEIGRIAAEIGGDLVKCIWPGSAGAFAQVVEGCTAPVLVAGGARAADPARAHAVAQQALAAGAAGIVFGRNIYEAADPEAELERYRAIVHARSVPA